MIFLFVMINILFVTTKAYQEQTEFPETFSNSTLQEYKFTDLGIFSNTLTWTGVGTFDLSFNKTFDLDNIGPAILVIDFTAEGDRPESPGYQIKGEFNLLSFEGGNAVPLAFCIKRAPFDLRR